MARSHTISAACAAALLLGACETPAADVQAARERISELEAELAQSATPRPKARKAAPKPRVRATPLDWTTRRVPRRVRRPVALFERPEQALATLAGELVDFEPGSGGDRAVLRLRRQRAGAVGTIAIRDLPDDSVGAQEFRAVLRQRGGQWHVAGLTQRWICRRGRSGDLCL